MDVHGDLSDYLKQMGIPKEETETYDKVNLEVKHKQIKKKKKKNDLFGDE
jgi:hypothetical protein